MFTDITARRQMEEARRRSEEKYRAVFENAAVGIDLVDHNGRFVEVNSALARMLGYAQEELRGRAIQDVTHPEDREISLRRLDDLLSGATSSYRLEKRYLRKDGSILWADLSVSSIRDDTGRHVATIGVIQDITERKHAEKERERLQVQLSQARKMESVGRLAGGVAHDFNNMLGVILGQTELALEQLNPDQPLFADLHEIRKAARRSADLTRQLLAFARRQTIAPKALDLNETVEGMLNMLRRIIGEDIHMEWKPGRHVWPIKMDPSQIDQILANLCVNARDAIAGAGKLIIQTGNARFDDACRTEQWEVIPGDFVLLSVSDNGCGMDRETLDNLFEPFFTTKEVGKGAGLGLATIYGIVKQNNGFIHVHSEAGQGSTFKIHLPRYVTTDEPVRKKEPSEPAARGSETILLVEDEPSILRLTAMMLEHQGYTVLAAGTPGDAARLAEKHRGGIRLLMTDVVMPQMNGQELANQLKPLNPQMKRLFMSGYTADVIALHGVLDEGVNFIQKPFSMKELSAKVREALLQQDD